MAVSQFYGPTFNDAQVAPGTGTQTGYVPTVIPPDITSSPTTGTSEETLRTFTLRANTLVRAGQTLRWTVFYSFANNTNAKRMRIKVGAVTVGDMSSSSSGGGSQAGGYMELLLTRTGAATQVALVRAMQNSGSSINTLYTALTADLTGDVTITCTGLTSVSAGDATVKCSIPEILG